MDYNSLPQFYESIDNQFNISNNNLKNATYTSVDSNFVYSSNYSRHRWFNYKEGFSPVLVNRIFNEYQLSCSAKVCDPFCGAGTTLMVAKKNNMHSIGFEVNPFAMFITEVKTDDYEQADIDNLFPLLEKMHQIDPNKNQPLPENEYIQRMFDPEMLLTELNIRAFIMNLPDSKTKNLLFFAWLCTLEECSLFRKAGNGLKKRKNKPNYSNGECLQFVLSKIYNKCQSISEDFDICDNGAKPELFLQSAMNLDRYINDSSIDLVLFSPPYANCFDYTKIYYLELWFGGFVNKREDQHEIRMNSVRSHCHATWPERYQRFYLPELNDEILPLLKQQNLWTDKIPSMINGYFADLEETLIKIYNVLKPEGHCAIVVSNSAYAGIVIPTDLFLAKIAQNIGYKIEEIEVERLIITSSQQYQKTKSIRKYLRESIVKLSK